MTSQLPVDPTANESSCLDLYASPTSTILLYPVCSCAYLNRLTTLPALYSFILTPATLSLLHRNPNGLLRNNTVNAATASTVPNVNAELLPWGGDPTCLMLFEWWTVQIISAVPVILLPFNWVGLSRDGITTRTPIFPFPRMQYFERRRPIPSVVSGEFNS